MLTELCVLFCADPLTPKRVDEHFADQAATVRDLGGQVVLIDHDALIAGHADAAVRRVPQDSGPWWYRGWMIPAASYNQLAEAMLRRGSGLRVTPRRYRAAHELPGPIRPGCSLDPAQQTVAFGVGLPVGAKVGGAW